MNMPKAKVALLRLPFLRNLPYDKKLHALKLIEKGADHALLYFWFNLMEMHYHPNFTLVAVAEQTLYFCNRNPTFEPEIIQWFQAYEQNLKRLT